MTISKKEAILARVELRINEIKTTAFAYDDVLYANDIGYVDRQFKNITQQDIQQRGMNWVIINEMRESWKPLIGGPFENKLQLQIILFTRLLQEEENLSTKMNSLQKDIRLAMLKDVELDGLCSYLVPVSTQPVDNMVSPYDGSVMYFDITYVTQGMDI